MNMSVTLDELALKRNLCYGRTFVYRIKAIYTREDGYYDNNIITIIALSVQVYENIIERSRVCEKQ